MLTLLALSLVGYALYSLIEPKDNTSPDNISNNEEFAVTTQNRSSAQIVGPIEGLSDNSLDHFFVAACVGAGISGIGLFYPLAGLLSAPVILYSAIPLFKTASHSLLKERRLRATMIDSIVLLSSVANGYYFITALFSVIFQYSHKLVRKTEQHTRHEMTSIYGEQPRFAWVLNDGVEIEVPVEQLKAGDIIVMRAGLVLPADGTIRQGTALIDQHILTGESQPVEKGIGESVFATSVMLSGAIHVEIEKAGSVTLAEQIGKILNQTADYRETIEARGERLADQSVFPFLALGALGLLTNGTEAGVAILNAKYSSGIRLAVPLSMLNFLNQAAKQGILIKDGRALELLSNIDTIVFDKTGTLTLLQPEVSNIYTCNGFSKETLLRYAAAAESKQTHPIAMSIRKAAAEHSISVPDVQLLSYEVGFGIQAELEGCRIQVGSARFMQLKEIEIPAVFRNTQAQFHEQGTSLVYVAIDGQLGGVIELRATLRPEAAQVIRELRERKLSLYILSGDHAAPTRRIAADLGIENYIAEVLPTEKAAWVEKLQAEGRKVCFVGDGINDSIALKKANASISLNGATTIATDTAQIVLMDGTLRNLPILLEIVANYQSNIRTSIVTNFGPAVICVGGVFLVGFGLHASFLLGMLSLTASVANGILPVLNSNPKHKERLVEVSS